MAGGGERDFAIPVRGVAKMRNGAGPTIVRSSSTRGFAIQEDISQPARTVRVPEVPKMLEAGQPSPRLVPGPDFDLGVVSCEIRR